MPFLLPLLLGVGVIALIASASNDKSAQVVPPKLPAGSGPLQFLSAADKATLLASLPLRQVANTVEGDGTETIDLLDPGIVGQAQAVSVVYGGNVSDGHYVLVSKPAGGVTKLLFVLTPGKESIASVGSPWSVFLAPQEAATLINPADAVGGMNTAGLMSIRPIFSQASGAQPSTSLPTADGSISGSSPKLSAKLAQAAGFTRAVPKSGLSIAKNAVTALPNAFKSIKVHYANYVSGLIEQNLRATAAGNADTFRSLASDQAISFAMEAANLNAFPKAQALVRQAGDYFNAVKF